MALENVLVYSFASGDNTYPHSGTFTIAQAGKIVVDDSNGVGDALFGDKTHTGGGDVLDQDVTSSTVAGISVGDTVDVRYKYTFTGSDGSSGTMYFIATNSANNYGPLFVSNTPLQPGVTYTFGTFNTDGAVPYASLVPCFTSGTRVLTHSGYRKIDSLREGDRVFTRDNGYQPVRWIGRCTVPAMGQRAPVHISKDILGNTADLIVSPNHRMLITGQNVDVHFGEREVLVSAKHLVGSKGISRRSGGMVTYVHILFDAHQIVEANGAMSESFFPGDIGLGALDPEARREVLGLFPELVTGESCGFEQTARKCLRQHEAELLQSAI